MRLVAAYSVSLSELRLAFDAPVVVTATATCAVRPLDAPAVTASAVAWAVDGGTATITLSRELTPRARYQIEVTDVADVTGQPLAADRVATFVAVPPGRPSARRFDLYAMLPAHIRRDDTGELARLLACLQDVVDLVLADLDRWPLVFDLARAPEALVDAILADLGNPFPPPVDVLAKRRLAGALVAMYREKGTAAGIQHALRFLLGIDALVMPLSADTVALGDAELGVNWILGPSTSWARYAFELAVSRVLTADERVQVRAIVDYLKPAHTHFVQILEPGAPAPDEAWVIDVGELGLVSALG
jgi:phage tail-like protein